jgi:hypothetical protein
MAAELPVVVPGREPLSCTATTYGEHCDGARQQEEEPVHERAHWPPGDANRDPKANDRPCDRAAPKHGARILRLNATRLVAESGRPTCGADRTAGVDSRCLWMRAGLTVGREADERRYSRRHSLDGPRPRRDLFSVEGLGRSCEVLLSFC